MQTISYMAARNNLAREMERVVRDHDYTIITRSAQPSVVMMSLDSFESWQETAYLLSSPANAERLLRSIAQLDAGEGQERELTDAWSRSSQKTPGTTTCIGRHRTGRRSGGSTC